MIAWEERWEPHILNRLGQKILIVATPHHPKKILNFLEELEISASITRVEKQGDTTYAEGWGRDVIEGEELLDKVEDIEPPSWLKFFGTQWTTSYKFPYEYGSFAVEHINGAVVASYLKIEEWEDSYSYYADWGATILKPPTQEIVLSANEPYHLIRVIKEKHNIEEVRIRKDKILALIAI